MYLGQMFIIFTIQMQIMNREFKSVINIKFCPLCHEYKNQLWLTTNLKKIKQQFQKLVMAQCLHLQHFNTSNNILTFDRTHATYTMPDITNNLLKYEIQIRTESLLAFLRKNALHDSHEMASKLQPRALSPQTAHILPSFPSLELIFDFIFPPPLL